MLCLKFKPNIVFVIVFILIFISEDTVTFGTNGDQRYILFRYIVYLFLTIWLMTKVRFSFSLKSRGVLYVVVVFFSILMTIFFNTYFTGGYLLQAWLVVLSFLIVYCVDFKEFGLMLRQIMYYLSVISLVVLLAYFLVPAFFEFFPVVTNYADVEFYNLYVCAVLKTEGVRNTGIFREPGVYAIYLIVAIIIELFNPRSYRYLLVYIITLLTTLSTAGYILIFPVFAVKMLQLNKKKWFLYMSFFSVVIVALAFLLPSFDNIVVNKLDQNSYEYISTLSRISSVTVPLSIFCDHPFCGVGLNNFSILYSLYSVAQYGIVFKADGQSTNTILNIAAIYGLFYALFVLFLLYKFASRFSRLKMIRIVLFIVLVLLSCNEELRFSLYFNTLLLYGASRS